MKESGKVFALAAVIITLIMGFAYLIGQQVLRMSANDPQVEISESVVEALSQGQDPQAFSSLNATDMATSLAPFVIVYDAEGKAIAGTSQLDGQTPAPPKGVFDFAKAKGENRLTWKPKEGVRIAAIIKPYGGEKPGFALAGKSLRETEKRTRNLLNLSLISWGTTLLISALGINLLMTKKQETDKKSETSVIS